MSYITCPRDSQAGYYSGRFSSIPAQCGRAKFSGQTTAIVGANGKGFFYAKVTRTNKPALSPVGSANPGMVRVGKTGRLTGVSMTKTRFIGRLKGKVISGRFVGKAPRCVGKFRLAKRP